MSDLSCTPVYLFFGPPGSGKGSISQMCKDRLKWAHLSTGSVCRKHVSEGTQIGNQIDFAMKSGKLVSDSVIIDMVVEWLKSKDAVASGIILDGSPRTIAQAEGILDYLGSEAKHYCVCVVNFDVNQAELIRRLTSRRVCENKECEYVYSLLDEVLRPKIDGVCDKCGSRLVQRNDDKEDVVKARLAVYEKHAQELLNFYKQREVVIISVSANLPIEEVFENFLKEVGFCCDTHKK